MELTNVDHHGVAAAGFAFMYALGGSIISFLGAVQPFWRLNMLVMASVALMTLIIVAVFIPESPIWLLRKDKESQAEASMRMIHGHHDFVGELTLLKFARKKMMEQAESKQNHKNNWSVSLHSIMTDVVSEKRNLPKPPFSFTFLVILHICIGWSGFTHITLNGPNIFRVKYHHQTHSSHSSIHLISFITESSSKSGN